MNDAGKTYCLMRLSECPDMAALKRTWESFAPSYQRDPDIAKMKDDMKAVLK